VGQKRLQSAIEAFEAQCNATTTCSNESKLVTVEWKPYIIDPNTNPQGEDFDAYNIRRWGSSSWTHHLKKEGRKCGANFSNWKWWPNTIKAHCLVKFAKEKYGVDTSKSNEEIFNRLYEQGENISLVDCLVDIGLGSLNIPMEDENELRLYLESGQGERDVRVEIQRGQSMYRISGVPFFVIESSVDSTSSSGSGSGSGSGRRPFGLSGAQEKQVFLEIFNEIMQEEKGKDEVD
jgi:predicted DsbA family dithiol-disulfide isomerase